jgi:hypothetical protein
MKYTVEMGSGAMMCTPSFIKIGSGIQKLIGGYTGTQTHREHDDFISLFLFFKIRKVGQKLVSERRVRYVMLRRLQIRAV